MAPLNRYLINNVEDIVFFLDFKVLNFNNLLSCSRNAQVTFGEKPQLKITSFQNYKHGYLIQT